MKKHEFTFNGYNATVLVPDNFNGKWLWKTEFSMLSIKRSKLF